MDGLLDRLRHNAETGKYNGTDYVEAANEIERLKSQLINGVGVKLSIEQLIEAIEADPRFLNDYISVSEMESNADHYNLYFCAKRILRDDY